MPSDDSKICFVLMPFREDLNAVYTEAIQSACKQAGFKAVRADDLIGPSNIHRDIIEHIFRSGAIVADLTDWNPNVFYELGVAHAIANKTFMIAQKDQKLPFDIHNYRCISYELSKPGLQMLSRQIVEYLEHLQEWSKRPTNPVQDFKSHDLFADPAEVQKLRQELQQKDAQLKDSAPKHELDKLHREHQSLQKKLREQTRNAVTKTEWEALQKQMQAKVAENTTLAQEIARLRSKITTGAGDHAATAEKVIRLRAEPAILSQEAVKAMLANKGFYDRNWNQDGKGVTHKYEAKNLQGNKIVIDHSTGLMWQQSGSSRSIDFAAAEKYCQDLNQQSFAGFTAWRLPTLEEAMSLMEREKKNGDLYIDPAFDLGQKWIWTADRLGSASGRAWYVIFNLGFCGYDSLVNYNSNVRAVRSGQSII